MMKLLSRPLFAVALVGALVGAACTPPDATTPKDKGSAKKDKKGDKDKPTNAAPDREGDDDAADMPRKLPPPVNVDAERRANSLAAEVELLRHGGLAHGSPYVGLVNAHEHLYDQKHLDRYLPAARAAGVVLTVLVSSPKFTLDGKGEKGEPGMSRNFEDQVLPAAQAYPGELVPFCTLDPKDADKLERLKKHVAMGAKGLKLYNGHSNFYDGPLDPPDMEPVWSYLEETQLPVLWHVNLAKFMGDFERVLEKHPKMNLMVPHYGVAFWQPNGDTLPHLKELMRKHPSLIVDTSLGTREILLNGMAAIEPARQVFVELFKEFPDQIVWGTDSVITGNPEKSTAWFEKVIWATRDHLEKDTFTTDLAAAYSKYYQKGRDPDGRYVGLGLPADVLNKVYRTNALRWLKLKDSDVAKAVPAPTAAAPSPTPATP